MLTKPFKDPESSDEDRHCQFEQRDRRIPRPEGRGLRRAREDRSDLGSGRAGKRCGTTGHPPTKNRANVSGSGKKPWRQKGTGRARVGEIRNPLWRKGGTVFGPQPRSYDYALPRKVKLGALRAAIAQKLNDGALLVVDKLEAEGRKTKAAAELFRNLGATGKTLVIDVKHDGAFTLSARNLAGVRLVASSRVTARDVIDTNYVVATRSALEKLQESLG
jgi:large subunit ribosomal protein L4